jgi:hypothetical protein
MYWKARDEIERFTHRFHIPCFVSATSDGPRVGTPTKRLIDGSDIRPRHQL